MYIQGSEEANIKIKDVENIFVSNMKNLRIKFKSAKFYDCQQYYFGGAIAVLGFVPPKWGVAMLGRREAVDEYKL